MYSLQKIKKHIRRAVNEALGNDLITEDDIVYPPNPDYGDLSLPCFMTAKETGKSPMALSGELVSLIKADDIIEGVNSAGPYLNFIIKKRWLANSVLSEIGGQMADYGKNDFGCGKKVMVEFSNVNTHKEYHVGHLRNLCLGDAVTKILSANGFQAIPVSYVNDFGIHVAKTLWAYQEYYKYEKLPKNKGYFLGKIYVKACEELEKNETAKKLAGIIMKKIEMRRGADYKLWVKTRLWSIEQFDKIYAELGIRFKHFFYESEFAESGKKLAEKLLKRGILEQSEGAVIANLQNYNLGTLVFLRSDGTALYPVADVPLALEKIKKYKLDKSIYVVDARQNFYLSQLFKILELAGSGGKFVHLSYEFVKLPDGMMSSRQGRVITYEELRDQMYERSLEETEARHRGWPMEKITETARKIALGAMKFEMIKVGRSSIISFDTDAALRFEGYTSAYLQYTCARINSMIKKNGSCGQRYIEESAGNLSEKLEHRLILKLADFPGAVSEAAEKYDPSRLAKSIFELAQAYNDYYHQIPVLKAETKLKNARLMLSGAVAQTIKNGLEMLGIETMEEM